MSGKPDINTPEHVRLMVDSFYQKVRIDPLIGDLFNNVIKDRWPEHLEKMYRFWGTVLLNERSYTGSPFQPHASMPLRQEHFDRWLKLFHETMNEHFIGPFADLAHRNADRMAAMFISKITRMRQHPNTFIQ